MGGSSTTSAFRHVGGGIHRNDAKRVNNEALRREVQRMQGDQERREMEEARRERERKDIEQSNREKRCKNAIHDRREKERKAVEQAKMDEQLCNERRKEQEIRVRQERLKTEEQRQRSQKTSCEQQNDSEREAKLQKKQRDQKELYNEQQTMKLESHEREQFQSYKDEFDYNTRNSPWGDNKFNNARNQYSSLYSQESSGGRKEVSAPYSYNAETIQTLLTTELLTMSTKCLSPSARDAYELRIRNMSNRSAESERSKEANARWLANYYEEKRIAAAKEAERVHKKQQAREDKKLRQKQDKKAKQLKDNAKKMEDKARKVVENAKQIEEKTKTTEAKANTTNEMETKAVQKAKKISKDVLLMKNKVGNFIKSVCQNVQTKTTALLHRYVKEFDCERVISEEEVPSGGKEVTPRKFPVCKVSSESVSYVSKKDDRPTYPSVVVTSASNPDLQHQSRRQKLQSGSGPEEKQLSRVVKGANNKNSSSKPKKCFITESNLERINSTTKKCSNGQVSPGSNVNLESFQDGQQLWHSDIEYYMEVLQQRYNNEARSLNISFVKEGLIAKQDNGWYYYDGLLYSCINPDYNRHFGILPNGQHFISYLFDREAKTLTAWSIDGISCYYDDMRAGIEVLATELAREFQIELEIQILPTLFVQTDAYNCGIACLLQFENILTGENPAKSLDDYREKVRTEIQQQLAQLSPEAAGEHVQKSCLNTKRKQIIKNRNVDFTEESSQLDGASSKTSSSIGRIDTLEKLVESYNGTFQRALDGIECISCKRTGTKQGRFTYDSSNGTNFENQTIPKSFQNLKQKIREHLETAKHKNTANQENPQQFPVQLDEATVQAGLVLARNAYQSYSEGKPYLSFPKSVAVDSCKNLIVGDINHSRNFVPKIGECFYTAFKARVKEILDTPLLNTQKKRPFAVIADKCTPNKDTMHLIGIVFHEEGELRAIFLKAEPLENSDGQYLAQSIIKALTEYFSLDEMRERCVGFAFDGQYFHLNVPRHIFDLLHIPEENRNYYSANHDPAHVIELAGKDAREQHGEGFHIGVPWIRSVISTVTKGGHNLTWGKNWAAVKKSFEELRLAHSDDGSDQLRLKRFKRWCDTRFTAYAVNVLESFRNNYPLVYDRFSKTLDSLYNDVRHVSFPLRLTCLIDIYGRIAETSNAVQRVNALPWHIHEEITELCSSLTQMKNILQDDTADHNTVRNLPHWPEFEKCINELGKDCKYIRREVTTSKRSAKTRAQEGKPDFQPKDLDTWTQQVYKEASSHINDFVSSLTARRQKRELGIDGHIQECFSFAEIAKRGNDSPPSGSFEEVVVRSQKVGYLHPSIAMDTMKVEYKNFVNHIHTSMGPLGFPIMLDRSEETNFYGALISGDALCIRNLFPHVAQLVAASCSRTHCESATESFGSTLKSIITGREALSTAHQDIEMFLRINGPPATDEANNLLLDALDLHFGSMWHVNRTSNKRKLQHYETSKSADAEKKKKGKISYPRRRVETLREKKHD